MVTRRVFRRGRREGRVRGRGGVRSVSLTTSTSGGQSMTLMEDDGSRRSEKVEGSASTETDDFEPMPSGFQPMLSQEPLVGKLRTDIPNVVQYELASRLGSAR